MKRILLHILLISGLVSCGSKNTIPQAATDYLSEVLALLEEKSVNRKKVNWTALRTAVFKKAEHANSIADTYPAITFAVAELNDNHSYFKPVIESEIEGGNKPLPVLEDEVTPEDIGYIRIPFCIGSEEVINDYIAAISAKIKEQSKQELKGWILDLRGNFGGNMWPMLLSIEPLIGNGTVGYFVNSDEEFQAWTMNKGKIYLENEQVLENLQYQNLDLSRQFLAVLTDNKTASSGEAIAVALKGRANAKSFGQATYGVSTGCVTHQLSDGSRLNLAESIFVDRNKNKYGQSIHPDIECEADDALKMAIDWLYTINRKNTID